MNRVLFAAVGGLCSTTPSGGPWRPEGIRWPGMLAVTADGAGSRVYAVSSMDGGSVHGLALDQRTGVHDLGTASTGGRIPCSVAVTPQGDLLLVANYETASVAVFRLALDGSIGQRTQFLTYSGSGPVASRQNKAHVHQVLVSPNGTLVLVSDLGSDVVHSYQVDADAGALVELGPPSVCPPGSGPRHLAFHPDGFVLCVDELSSTVSVYDLDVPTGALSWRRHTPVGARCDGGPNYPSEIVIAADGRYCYVANRGANTVSVLEVSYNGLIERRTVATGEWPIHLALVGDRLWCACRDSDEIHSWRLDTTGIPVERKVAVSVPSPLWIVPSLWAVG